MPRIHVVGWKPGLQKVSVTNLYQRELGASLGKAKGMTDALLDGTVVAFEIEPAERAAAVAAELTGLGAVVEVTSCPVDEPG